MSTTVDDDFVLLERLLADSEVTSPLWNPTAFWRNYTGRITDEIRRVGLSAFQSNTRICKGYGPGGAAEAFGPVTGWKRRIWHSVVRMPLVDRVIAEQQRLTVAEHRYRRAAEVKYARLVLDRIAQQTPDLYIPKGIGNGQADDAFEWRGSVVTASWVSQLARIADFMHLYRLTRWPR